MKTPPASVTAVCFDASRPARVRYRPRPAPPLALAGLLAAAAVPTGLLAKKPARKPSKKVHKPVRPAPHPSAKPPVTPQPTPTTGPISIPTPAAETDGGSIACFTAANGSGQEPSWLNDAVAFTGTGTSHSLLDAKGHVLRQLQAGHGIIATPNIAQLRARLATAPPLPGGLFAVTAKSLVGHWLPAPVRHYQAGTPAVTFASDGSWSGSDGCNGQGGRWRLGQAGAFVGTAGPSTLIGCAGVEVGSWISLARSAGFDGTTLVLLDGSGKQIGRLVRG